MNELLPLSVGLGLAVSLLMTDIFGIATGGLIVPGYVALNLGAPRHLLATLAAALLTFGVMRALGSIMILYGRRRAALSILVGYLMGAAMGGMTRQAALTVGPLLGPAVPASLSGFEVIGYVIPGLLALCLERQGVLETLWALWTAAVIVRLGLVLVAGGQMVL